MRLARRQEHNPVLRETEGEYVCVGVCVSACVRERGCVSDLLPGTPRQKSLRCKSAQDRKCVYMSTDACFHFFLPDTLNDFFFLNGRS